VAQDSVLQRQDLYLKPDPARVIMRSFNAATEPRDFNPTDKTKTHHIVERILALPEADAERQLAMVIATFQDRHRDLLGLFEGRFAETAKAFGTDHGMTTVQRQLIGAYFSNEYSFQAIALFNPSIVSHPDQSGWTDGGRRIVLSLRAVGEGHISSLAFREGSVAADGRMTLDPCPRLASLPTVASRVAGPHGDDVTVVFEADRAIGERVIFPVTLSQSNGIEDARFVEFDDDGRTIYYATYTAYTGRAIRSELMQTVDFQSFRMSPLTGAAARNKGMALFPRRIGGRYAMIARQDNENLYLIYSDDLYDWGSGQAILQPRYPWEFVQIGTCGSPIEIDEGWLLLTHGVGAVRQYSIGAILLDKQDPTKVIARSREPLVRPEPAEREGYVPNVVYTCGAMRHGERIVLPYAICDTYSNVATVSIRALLAALEGC